MVSFNSIPDALRVPLAYIEFDNSRANTGTPAVMHTVLVLGQRLPSGSQAAGVPVRVTGADQAEQLFGRGSMLAEMFTALKAANRHLETWAIALDDDGAATAATGSITVTGTATAAGTLALYIGGRRVRVGIFSGDTQDAVATAVAAAISAETRLPVTALVNGVTANQVDLTCRWAGETGNGIDLRDSYYQDESAPAGLSVSYAAMAGGAANPDLATAIAAMGDTWWHTVVMPYTDTSNLDALEAELADRWGPLRQMTGQAYCAFRGTHAESGTFGSGRNSHLVSCMPTGIVPQPVWIWAAVDAVVAGASLAIDPARPLQTLELPGIMPPAPEDRWDQSERNLLLYDGMSTYTVDAGGTVRIERQVTMYQQNAYSVDDPSYLDVTTPATLSHIRHATRSRITQKFPRHKLADDGARFGPGQAVVTPRILRAELLALFRELEEAALVENFDQFSEDLVVERDPDDRNRVNVLMPPDLVNQLRIFAAQLQFVL